MAYNKKTIEDIQVKGKRVLVRCDFNVPMKEGKITDENDKAYYVQIDGLTYELKKIEITQDDIPKIGDEVEGFIYDNKSGLTGSIFSRPVINSLGIYKHYAIVYGFDKNNTLWMIENNSKGVECITFNDFLNGQNKFKVENLNADSCCLDGDRNLF